MVVKLKLPSLGADSSDEQDATPQSVMATTVLATNLPGEPILIHWIASLRPFSGGGWFDVDTSAAQASVRVAERTQDELTGYEFVQWPIDGPRPLAPKMRNGEAVWMNTSTDTVVAPIGALMSEPHVQDQIGRQSILCSRAIKQHAQFVNVRCISTASPPPRA